MLSGGFIDLDLADSSCDDEEYELGCKMTIEEWLNGVESGSFIDYDGYGCWATENDVSTETVCPSDITVKGIKPPAWATHIEWYNR